IVPAEGVEDVEAGRKVYEKRCMHCHGAEGKGDGPAADLLYPRPRDFTRGQYKVRSTVSGALPTDDDLFKIIGEGMGGTSMPGWKKLLNKKEMWQLIAYMKTFSRRFERQKKPPEKISMGKPLAPTEESIVKGKELYQDLECWKCHGDEGRGDGPSAPTLVDDWENSIRAADLTRPWTFRGGGRDEDIYRTFTTGFAGTPMPSYADVFETPEEAEEMNWHLVNYVSTFAPLKEKPEVRPVIRSMQISDPIPDDPSDPLWENAETFSFPLVGQIIKKPRWFTPSIDLITIRSLRNEEEIGFLLEWHDRTESKSIESSKSMESIESIGNGEEEIQNPEYPDAIALQFPVKIPEGGIKPYFLMGDSRNPVNLWIWSASDGANAIESNAKGMDKITSQPEESQNLQTEGVYHKGSWQVVMKRSLTTENGRKDIQFVEGRFIPLAFHVWDGSNRETGKQHAISSWYLLYLKPQRPLRSFLFPPLTMLLAIGMEFWFVRKIRKNKK
ncbi:c-type cytochrome, partial [candidate division TA06 bacterium]|nr:c-type cytochrome [candidate division TA06 bacterium]